MFTNHCVYSLRTAEAKLALCSIEIPQSKTVGGAPPILASVLEYGADSSPLLVGLDWRKELESSLSMSHPSDLVPE